jgi:hypothetical protein
MMVMKECGRKLRGANLGQEAPILRSSRSVLSIAEQERGKESGMK